MKVSVNLPVSMVLKSHSLEAALGSVQPLCSSELKHQPVVNVSLVLCVYESKHVLCLVKGCEWIDAGSKQCINKDSNGMT